MIPDMVYTGCYGHLFPEIERLHRIGITSISGMYDKLVERFGLGLNPAYGHPDIYMVPTRSHIGYLMMRLGLSPGLLRVDHLARDLKIWELRRAGLTFQEIGLDYGISKSRVQQIYGKIDKRLARQHQRLVDEGKRGRSKLARGRVLDMGGARDVWHTWTPEAQAMEFGTWRGQ